MTLRVAGAVLLRVQLAVLILPACDHDRGRALPECDDDLPGGVVSGDFLWTGQRRMVVVRSDGEALDLVEDPDCDPWDEGSLTVATSRLPADGWLPPVGAELVASSWPGLFRGYAELATAGGALVWAGGEVHPGEDDLRFRWVAADGAACADFCTDRRPAAASLDTDDAVIPLVPFEQRSATIAGEPFVAQLEAAAQYGDFGPTYHCDVVIEELRPSFAAVTLTRTTPLEVPIVEPGDPPIDDCPVDLPTDGDPCTTRPELQCDYVFGGGCTRSLECRGCFWHKTLEGEPFGVDCGIDPGGCNGDGCPEESVCTSCPCLPDESRWRCVFPGESCPSCE